MLIMYLSRLIDSDIIFKIRQENFHCRLSISSESESNREIFIFIMGLSSLIESGIIYKIWHEAAHYQLSLTSEFGRNREIFILILCLSWLIESGIVIMLHIRNSQLKIFIIFEPSVSKIYRSHILFAKF